jgi:fructose-1,6-bisphosphatase/inositol monophosphatase family enzyme
VRSSGTAGLEAKPTQAELIEIEECIRAIAKEELLGRFRRRGGLEIREKGPGDLVTAADLAMEWRLAEFLGRLRPEARIVGEEAVFDDPAIMDLLDGDGPVWLIDPLDGTSNFIEGSDDFSVLVALVQRGRVLAGWVHAPALNWTASAVVGQGATLDGRPLTIMTALERVDAVITTHPSYMTAEDRTLFVDIAAALCKTVPCRGAGLEYVSLARGGARGAIFTWEKPWDHAAGLLIHSEAGGLSGTSDGLQLSLSGGNSLPLLVANDEQTMALLRRLVNGSRSSRQVGPQAATTDSRGPQS